MRQFLWPPASRLAVLALLLASALTAMAPSPAGRAQYGLSMAVLLLLIALGMGWFILRARTASGHAHTAVALGKSEAEREALVEALAAEKEALEQAVEAKDLLLYEVNHRVKNSLQLVTSILAIEASKIQDPQARATVMGARRKIAVIAQLHQRLYSGGQHATVDFKAYLEDMIAGLLNSSGRDATTRMELEWQGDPMLSIRLASPLGLAINEIVTNALKYAIGEQGGSLIIQGARTADELEIAIEDDGPGLPADFDIKLPKSLGMQIVSNLVKQMGGGVAAASIGTGARFTIRVPLEADTEAHQAAR